jgi:aminomethyltransferase
MFQVAAGSEAVLMRADDRALIAVQGPEAAAVVQEIFPEAAELVFMTHARVDRDDDRYLVSRSGYTGEDGYEILAPADRAEDLWQRLLEDPRCKPIGLGARDSLRLEAGLPLYGHDADETTSPVEAGLSFAISERRRRAATSPAPRGSKQNSRKALRASASDSRSAARRPAKAPISPTKQAPWSAR